MSGCRQEMTLTPITDETVRSAVSLKTAAGQATVPEDRRVLYAYRYASTTLALSTLDPGAWLRAVEVNGQMAGFVWLDGETRYGVRKLRSLLIDAGYQGKGLGSKAMDMIIHEVRADAVAHAIDIQCLPSPGGPEDFFRRFGFLPTGETRGEEIIMTLDLNCQHPSREITLRSINPAIAEYICHLEGSEHVAPNPVSLVQAHYSGKAWLRAIYLGREPIGLVMLYDDPEDEVEEVYYLWRLMLSARYRGRGYGRRVVEMVADYVCSIRGGRQLRVSCDPGPGGPEGFYLKLGFTPTGDFINEEKVFFLDL